MNEYVEMRKRQQEEHDNAHLLGFAFSDAQFREMMNGWGLDPAKKSDLGKVSSVGAGGYILKENIPVYNEMSRRHKAERREAIAADKTGDGFIYQMFYYELANHEYGWTGEYDDTLDALGYTWEQVQADDRLRHGLKKAASKIMEEV